MKKGKAKKKPSPQVVPPGTGKAKPGAGFYSPLLILLVGILCYSNTLHGPFVFDDIPNIVNRGGLHITSFQAAGWVKLKQTLLNNPRPVTFFSFALNYYFGKLDTFGYHLVNLIIHLLTAVLVYLFLRGTMLLPSLRERYGNMAEKTALLTGLLFVAHPVQTQAVTYTVQRLASLAGMFFMLSLYCYLKARLAEGKKRVVLFTACAAAMLLAFGSKENSITLPVFIALYEYYFLRQLKSEKGQKKWFYTLIALTLGLGVLAGLVYTGFDPAGWLHTVYRKYSFTPGQRMLTQLRVVVLYLSLLIFPLPSRFNLDYDFPLSYSLINPPETLICFFIVISLIVIGFYLVKRRPLFSFAIIWFWGNLLLESSFLPLELVYEHRLYLPSLGFFILLSVLLVTVIEGLNIPFRPKKVISGVVMFILIGMLGSASYSRNSVWQDRVKLWADAARKSPRKARPYYNLANVYAQRRDYDRAIPWYRKTIQLKPGHAKAHNNMGFCYFFKGDIQKAIAGSKTALRYNRKLVDAYFNLGTYYCNMNKYDLGKNEFRKALKINPNYKKAIAALKELEKIK